MPIDYWNLNNRTVNDSYSFLRIEELLYSCSGAVYCSTLGMNCRYHQVEFEEYHKQITVFTVEHLCFTSLTGCHLVCQIRLKHNRNQCIGKIHTTISYIHVYTVDIIAFSRI